MGGFSHLLAAFMLFSLVCPCLCVWVLLMLELVVEPPKLLKWTAARVCKCYYINGGLLDCDGTARLPRVCTCLLS